MKKQIALSAVLLIFLLFFSGVRAEDPVTLPDLSSFLSLFGEEGLKSIHLEDFSFFGIDYDTILRIMSGELNDYSKLNYDALLELLKNPETQSQLGIRGFDQAALKTWLKDKTVKETVCSWMTDVRNGGSLSEKIHELSEDMDFLESFSAITGGSDFAAVIDKMDSAKAADIMNKASGALLSPKTGPASETAILLSQLVQAASDTLEGEN